MSKTTFPKVPKFDMAALVALQKANIETLVAAQKILYDLVQTVAKKQAEYIKESFAKSEAMFKSFDAKKDPAAYAEELKAAMEKVMADAKKTVDLGVKAQSEVVDLFVKRATANFEDMKAVAA